MRARHIARLIAAQAEIHLRERAAALKVIETVVGSLCVWMGERVDGLELPYRLRRWRQFGAHRRHQQCPCAESECHPHFVEYPRNRGHVRRHDRGTQIR